MAGLADELRDPILLEHNRLPRFYRGGAGLDEFRGQAGKGPEDWVGSATRSWTPPGERPSDLGPSAVEVGGRRLTLAELLQAEPEALVGRALVERAGPTLGVLVKLLDAGERLPVHCHPSREQAAALLGSRFGKTEAWLILATRDPANARVWAGFREDVERAHLREWIEQQSTDQLLDALVEHRVAPGDVLLIRAGTPHAIGAGIFLLELQEPTDYSVVAETRGFPIDPSDASLRLGWDTGIDFFDRRAAPDPRQQPRRLTDDTTNLLEAEADTFFRALRMHVSGRATPPFEPAYAVGVVLGGTGSIEGASARLDLARGATFALPAGAVGHTRIVGARDLDLAWCLGPDPTVAW